MNFNTTLAQRVRLRAHEYESFITVLLVVSIYFSTTLAIVVSAILGVVWLLSTQFIELPGTLKRNPVAAWAMLLLSWFILGSCYTSATNSDAFSMIMKYRELLFIPVLISFLTTERYRSRVWKAFFITYVLALLFSYLMYVGILDLNNQGDPSFKGRITHSIFISFFAFFCAHKAYDRQLYTKLYLVLFVLCLHNLFFVVPGRTGQLVVIALILLFAMQRFGNKERLLTVIAVVLLVTLFLNFSDRASRISEGIANTQAYLKPVPEQTESSMGLRFTFWKYSLKLMAEKPLLGHGTGSFSKEYHRLVPDERFKSTNPHNEFFMIGVQLGLVGLFIYSGFLGSQFYYAKKLPDKERWLAQGLLLSLIITSTFNSPILDHTEGHWFATMIALCFASLQANNKSEISHA